MREQRPQFRADDRLDRETIQLPQDADVEAKVRCVAMVVGGLLKIGPVRSHLFVQVLDEYRPSQTPPPPGIAELGKQGAKIQQAQSLAREVGIGTGIGRQKRLDVSTVQVEELQRAPERGLGQGWRGLEEVQPPDPGNRAERQLEAAGPVDPAFGRVPVHPAHQVLHERRRVPFVPAIPVGFPQNHEVLMPIELPNQLVVGRTVGLGVLDHAPMQAADALSGHRIEVPVHREAKVHAGTSQQVEQPLPNTFGLFEDAVLELRPAAAEGSDDVRRLVERSEEARRRTAPEPLQQGGGRGDCRSGARRSQEAGEPAIIWDADLARDAYALRPHGQLLPRTHPQLGETPPLELRPGRERA